MLPGRSGQTNAHPSSSHRKFSIICNRASSKRSFHASNRASSQTVISSPVITVRNSTIASVAIEKYTTRSYAERRCSSSHPTARIVTIFCSGDDALPIKFSGRGVVIGVCIPAHNEETRIRRCLMSILKAARHPALLGEEVAVVLVVDASRDRTASMGALEGVSQINVCHRNVGRSRGEGAALLIARGAQWLAFTDADSVVPHDWLVRQLSYRADAVCGTVRVIEWGAYGPLADFVRHSFLARYRDVDG